MSGAFYGASSSTTPAPVQYSQSFSGLTSVLVPHNLGYPPDVYVRDINGNLIIGLVTHLTVDSFSVSFNIPMAGTIHYR